MLLESKLPLKIKQTNSPFKKKNFKRKQTPIFIKQSDF